MASKKGNIFANTGILRGIGGRGANDKFEAPDALIQKGDYRIFGF